MRSANERSVRAWEESVTIPTYSAPAPDLNPMFLEKRIYQGSSGKVYPNPFTDKISTEKRDQEYRAVFLENEYVKLMILPEMGGRIHSGLDQTNQYDFLYVSSDGGALFPTGGDSGFAWEIGRFISIPEDQALALRKRWLISNFLANKLRARTGALAVLLTITACSRDIRRNWRRDISPPSGLIR